MCCCCWLCWESKQPELQLAMRLSRASPRTVKICSNASVRRSSCNLSQPDLSSSTELSERSAPRSYVPSRARRQPRGSRTQPRRLLWAVTRAARSLPQMGSSRPEDSALLSLWVASCWPSFRFGKEDPRLGVLGSVHLSRASPGCPSVLPWTVSSSPFSPSPPFYPLFILIMAKRSGCFFFSQ